jgi:hypothetical protein
MELEDILATADITLDDMRWIKCIEDDMKTIEKIVAAVPADLRDQYRDELMYKLMDGETLCNVKKPSWL